MNAIDWKKLLLPNIPYLLFVYLFDKSGRRYALRRGSTCPVRCCRLGRDFRHCSFCKSTSEPAPALMDLLIGIFGAVLIRLIVYVKGKNAKKYRKGIEYGSARWGTAEI